MASFTWRSDAADDLADGAADEYESRAIHQVVQHVKASAPIDSGRLQDNVRYVREGRGRSTRFAIISRAVDPESNFAYASAVVLGRPAMTAKAGRAFRWVDKATREVVFAKSVKATKPNNYLAKGLRRSGLRQVREISA